MRPISYFQPMPSDTFKMHNKKLKLENPQTPKKPTKTQITKQSTKTLLFLPQVTSCCPQVMNSINLTPQNSKSI